MSPEVQIPEGFGCRFGRQYRAADVRPMAYGLQPNRQNVSGFDAFTNAAARMGWGTPSVAEAADYNLVRLSYDYWLLITLYRNHWISRRIVDGPAQDMVRAWPKLTSDVAPDDLSRIDRALRKTGTRSQVLKTLQWARLFGGAGALIVIDGQENQLDEPLDLDNIEPGAYRGLLPFDRWTGINPAGSVCTDISRPLAFNLPEYYEVHSPSGGDSYRVHPSRILRFSGPTVPAPEHQAQQYWGISVLEPAYEEIRKRDNMSWNLLSLSFRSSIIAIRWKDMAQALSGAGMSTKALEAFHSRMEAVNQLLSNQNLLVLPDDGGLEHVNYSPSGWDGIYGMFQMDVAGASGYTVTRLFGRTITGLAQSNDADERLYEERVAMEQDESLRPQLEKLYPVICMSALGEVPDDLDFTFPSVRVLTEEEKSKLSSDTMASIVALGNAGYLTKVQALKEIKQQSDVTGFGTNITDEDIEQAERDEDMGLGAWANWRAAGKPKRSLRENRKRQSSQRPRQRRPRTTGRSRSTLGRRAAPKPDNLLLGLVVVEAAELLRHCPPLPRTARNGQSTSRR